MRFIWPLADHYITRDFDYKASIYIGGQHAAVDLVRLQGDTFGRDILAVADGVVVGDGYDSISGHHIILSHADGWRSIYRHLAADAPPVVGHQIAQGEIIGNVGSTGWSTGPHLHLDLQHKEKKDDTAFSKSGWWAHNPELYLGKEEDMSMEEMKALITEHEKRPHYGFQQIADNLPALNKHLTDTVNALIETQVKGQNHYSFQQITDNIRGLNSRLIEEINALIAVSSSGDGLNEEQVQSISHAAAKDEIDLANLKAQR